MFFDTEFTQFREGELALIEFLTEGGNELAVESHDPAKLLVSARYNPEMLEYFKSTGPGWKARMDSMLKRYVARHSCQ